MSPPVPDGYTDVMNTKQGRARRYDFSGPKDFADKDVAAYAAALVELSERAADQLIDLPPEGMDFLPPGTNLSIGRLALHMAWAEASWLRRASGRDMPADLEKILAPAALDRFSENPAPAPPAPAVADLYRRLRSDYSWPILREVRDPGAVFTTKGLGANYRGILAHLLWHWTYHSGQIGLIRLQWGSDYVWTFGDGLIL